MPRKATNNPSKSRRSDVKPTVAEDSSEEERPSMETDNGNNSEENARATIGMVRYFLNFSATRIPIQRASILKGINISAKTFQQVFADCTETLRHVYGLEVTEVEIQKKKVLIVNADKNYIVSASIMPEQRNEISLLFLVLAYIFMKGGAIDETHLFHFLDNLDIRESETHPIYGDIGKVIREKFTRQLYLKRNKIQVEGVNEVQIQLTWGSRADKEFDKKDVLHAVANIMDKSPMSFVNQHHEASHGEEVLDVMSD